MNFEPAMCRHDYGDAVGFERLEEKRRCLVIWGLRIKRVNKDAGVNEKFFHCGLRHLTFDVRGGLRLAAGRPLDGGVRPTRANRREIGPNRQLRKE